MYSIKSSSFSWNHPCDTVEDEDHIFLECTSIWGHLVSPHVACDFLWECNTAFISLHPISWYTTPVVFLVWKLVTCLPQCLPDFSIRSYNFFCNYCIFSENILCGHGNAYSLILLSMNSLTFMNIDLWVLFLSHVTMLPS